MQIRKDILKRISDSTAIKAKLSDEMGKHYITVERWVESNHFMLTTASALKVLRKELGLTDKQILEEVKNHAA